MQLNKDWRAFIESFNANAVEYLIVGGFAVAWHGYPRFTCRYNFFVRAEAANAERAVQALRDFGFASLGIAPEDLIKPVQIIQLGAKPNRIDIVTSIERVSFDEAWPSRVAGSIAGVPAFFIGLDELIRNNKRQPEGAFALVAAGDVVVLGTGVRGSGDVSCRTAARLAKTVDESHARDTVQSRGCPAAAHPTCG